MLKAAPVGLCCTLVALAAACGAETDRLASVEVLDSAGVRMVLNPAEVPVRVVLDGAPLVEVPASPTDEASLFEVQGGVLRADGGFVLANAGNHEILYFGAEGVLERRVGREGEGPGEFRGITWMEARADGGVTVGDSRVRRVTTFGPTGEISWERRFTPLFDEGALPSNAITASGFAVSALEDGRLIGYPRAFALPTGSRGPLPLQGDFALYPADTSATTDPEPLGRRTVFNWYEDPGQEGFPVASVFQAPRIWWGGHSGRLALTESAEPRIEVFDGGRLTLVVRERRVPGPFEPDSVPATHALAADSLPAYQDLRVDGLHRIWALLTLDEDPATWRVFNASGVALADVLLPGDARLLDANERQALLLRRDTLDVESVALYRLTVPGS